MESKKPRETLEQEFVLTHPECETRYRVRLHVYEYYVDFQVRPREADRASLPMIDGTIKWDGCSNITFPSAREEALHGCSRSDLAGIGVLLGDIWDEATRLMEILRAPRRL